MKIPAFLKKSKKAFTLIELLVVIGILAVLLAIVLIAINPQRQFEQANDTQRSSDVNAMLNAVHQYMVEQNGQLPAGIVEAETPIADTGVDLCLLVPDFIAALPVDPQSGIDPVDAATCTAGTAYDTGYTIQATGNRVTVNAPDYEGDAPISVTR
jgi:type IV pilus assembly protein PilA